MKVRRQRLVDNNLTIKIVRKCKRMLGTFVLTRCGGMPRGMRFSTRENLKGVSQGLDCLDLTPLVMCEISPT